MKAATAMQPIKETTTFNLAPRGDVFDRMQEIYDDIARRAFEIFETNGHVFGNDLENWLRAESEVLHPTKIELSDNGEVFKIQAEVPGFKPEELEISAEAESLTITGKHETKKEEGKSGERVVYSERSADRVLRVIELPESIVPEKVKATLKNGVLELEMPKAQPAKKFKIELKAA
jgi:HSP20 family protein